MTEKYYEPIINLGKCGNDLNELLEYSDSDAEALESFAANLQKVASDFLRFAELANEEKLKINQADNNFILFAVEEEDGDYLVDEGLLNKNVSINDIDNNTDDEDYEYYKETNSETDFFEEWIDL